MVDAAHYHGEYKMPAGKLVQVDFTIDAGRLTSVMVSGDFFLYPEEALITITGALEGSPVDLTSAERTALIGNAIPLGVEWLGASPEGLARAIERALMSHG